MAKEKEDDMEQENKGDGSNEEGDALEDEDKEGEDGGKKKKGLLDKKRLIIIVAAVILLAAGGVVAFMMMGSGKQEGSGGEGHGSGGEGADVQVPNIVYYDLAEFLVNLNSAGKQPSFLKVKITLELPGESEKEMVQAKLPRIRDSFNVYLRELRLSDLQGSGGSERLREEMLLRVNKILYPSKVRDILFTELLTQ